MDGLSSVSSIDWSSLAGALTAFCTAVSTIVGAATWYLRRLIKDGFEDFEKILDDKFVTTDTHDLDLERIGFSLHNIESRLRAIDLDLVQLQKEIGNKKGSV